MPAILSRVMKSLSVQLHPARDVTHLFVRATTLQALPAHSSLSRPPCDPLHCPGTALLVLKSPLLYLTVVQGTRAVRLAIRMCPRGAVMCFLEVKRCKFSAS